MRVGHLVLADVAVHCRQQHGAEYDEVHGFQCVLHSLAPGGLCQGGVRRSLFGEAPRVEKSSLSGKMISVTVRTPACEVQLLKTGAIRDIEFQPLLCNFSGGRDGPPPPDLVILGDSASSLRE